MQDTTYSTILMHLMRCKTTEEVVSYFEPDHALLDKKLLHYIGDEIERSNDKGVVETLEDLFDTLTPLLNRKCLLLYLDMSLNEGIVFALAHLTELHTDDNFSTLAQILLQDDLTNTEVEWLTGKRDTLIQMAVDLVAYKEPWIKKRVVYLYGLSWLTHPVSKMFLIRVGLEHPGHEHFIDAVEAFIADCQLQGPGIVVRSQDIVFLLQQLKGSNLKESVNYLMQALKIAAVVRNTSWNELFVQTQNAQAELMNAELRSLDFRNLTDEFLQVMISSYQMAMQTNAVNEELCKMIQLNLFQVYLQRIETRHTVQTDFETALGILNYLLNAYPLTSSAITWGLLQRFKGLLCAYHYKSNPQDIQRFNESKNAYESAFRVFTSNGHPKDWARTNSQLGSLYATYYQYFSRNVDDITHAIDLLGTALTVFSFEFEPSDWVEAKLAMARAYDCISPSNITNKATALSAYTEVADNTTLVQNPVAWASAHQGIAGIYQSPFFGRPEHMEYAIEEYTYALDYFKPHHAPGEWAEIHYNLGSIYLYRQLDDKQGNITSAIQSFVKALEYYTAENNAEMWAKTNNNLGIAYKTLEGEKKPEYLKLSLQAYKNSITVRTYETSPDQWAQMQHNMGNIYGDEDFEGDREQNIEAAIEAYDNALKVRSTDKRSKKYGQTLNSRGLIFLDRIKGDKKINLAIAIADLKAALAVFDLNEDTPLYQIVSYNLGLGFHRQESWTEARHCFEEAHKALKILIDASVLLESRSSLAKENSRIYFYLIHCCLTMKDYDSALLYTVTNKGRTLTDQLSLFGEEPVLNGIDPIRYSGLKNRLFAAKGIANSIDLSQITALYQNLGDSPIIEYTKHAGGWGAFIINQSGTQYVSFVSDLYDQLADSFAALMIGGFWDLKDWQERLQLMYVLLFEPLKSFLPVSGKLIVCPTESFHLIPFQALIDHDQLFLSESYSFSFAPNAGVLSILYNRKKSQDNPRMYVKALNVAFAEPEDKIYAAVNLELKMVNDCFEKSVPISGPEATVNTVVKALNDDVYDVIHFNCHGLFNFFQPGESGLRLANGEFLSVHHILANLHLKGTPLVTLSACQSGVIKPIEGDESPVVSWSFLNTGASAILSSLWPVSSISTPILFEHFYRIRQHREDSHGEVLRQAMAELRRDPNFTNPKFWAGFQVTGLPFS